MKALRYRPSPLGPDKSLQDEPMWDVINELSTEELIILGWEVNSILDQIVRTDYGA
jgi:hypothetical protein